MNKLRDDIENIQFQLHSAKSNKQQLVDLIENKSNYSLGVRSILKAKQSLNGIVGVLGDLLQSESTYEDALSAALAGSMQFIVCKEEKDAKRAISFLRDNHAGRATFLPISNMHKRSVREEHLLLCENFDGYLGVLSDFVKSEKPLGEIIENQLGNVLLVENINDATALSKATFSRYRIVTLQGDVVNVGGSLTGGRYKASNSTYTSQRELVRVEENIKNLESELTKKKHSLNELETELREIAHFLLQKNVSFAKLEMEVTTKRGELQLHKSEYETLTHQDVELSQLESGETSNQLIEELNKAQQLKDELTESIQAKRQLRMSFVNENEELENRLREQRKATRLMQEEMTQKQIEKAKKETEVNNYLLRLNDEYKMTYEFAHEEYNQDIDMNEAKIKVKDLILKIESLGHVNIEAIETYKEVSKRYETLNEQRLDLINAQDSLLKAIDERYQ